MAKSGKKKTRITCLGCGSAMKKKSVACSKCGRARQGSFRSQPAVAAAKAVFQPASGPAFVAKAMKPRCARCSAANRAGSLHCTACGSVMLAVVKSAGDQRRDSLMKQFYREDDPEFREGIWQAAHPEIYGGNGTGGWPA
jgi:hypothetical protein